MTTNNFDLHQIRVLLSRTPGTLRALLDGLPDELLRGNEGPDTFSPFDVVGHMITGEKTDWIARGRIILEQGLSGTFERFDRVGHKERDAQRSIGDLLDEFAELRAKNLETLSSWRLKPEQLERQSRHPVLGVVSLRQLLATWAAHDMGHVAQVARVIAKQYKEDAGPWVQFLPVLTDRPRPQS
jgi:DinB superfamily